MTEKAEWLAGLKVGDLVVVESDNPLNKEGRLATVEKLTPHQIVIARGCRYWRNDGKRVRRSGIYQSWLAKATRTKKAAIAAKWKKATG